MSLVYFGFLLYISNLAGNPYLNLFLMYITDIPSQIFLSWFVMKKYVESVKTERNTVKPVLSGPHIKWTPASVKTNFQFSFLYEPVLSGHLY